MKLILITILLMHNICLEAQVYGRYGGNGPYPIKLIIEKDSIFLITREEIPDDLYDDTDIIFGEDVWCSSSYKLKNDTILFSFSGIMKRIAVIDTFSIVLIDSIRNKIEAGTVFYCYSRWSFNGQSIYSGSWKNGKKQGDWRYYDPNRINFYWRYVDGELIDTIKVTEFDK